MLSSASWLASLVGWLPKEIRRHRSLRLEGIGSRVDPGAVVRKGEVIVLVAALSADEDPRLCPPHERRDWPPSIVGATGTILLTGGTVAGERGRKKEV